MTDQQIINDEFTDPDVEDGIFHQVFADSPLAGLLIDRNSAIQAWNKRACQALSKIRELQPGGKITDYIREADRDLLLNAFEQSILDEFDHERDLQIQSKKGDIWLVRVNSLRDQEGSISLLYMTLIDISGSKGDNGLYDLVSWHDPLTGLPNRRLLFDRLQHSLRDAGRRNEKLALLFVDCDNFKQINDSYGHDVGDMVLQHIAGSMSECLRENDTLARMGGDEFMVLMHHIQNVNDVLPVARRLLESVGRPFVIRSKEFRISASIGISLSPDDGDSPAVLVRNADLAMYQAKENGRGRFVLFNESLRQAAGQREKLTLQLQQAIANRELDIHYHPMLSVAGKKILGIEALLRWRKDPDNWVAAGKFLPLAESLNLGISFYDWAIEQACRQMADWLRRGLLAGNPDCRMAINLDCCQLRKQDFFNNLQAVQQRYGLSGRNLAFEIKEADIRSADRIVEANLRSLIEQGSLIYLDDFCQGFYSLFKLSSISFDWIKIDQSFTSLLLGNNIGRTLLKTLIEVAHDLKIKVMAEGVETEENLLWLKESHCDGIQGFYFCRPMSAGQMELLLELSR